LTHLPNIEYIFLQCRAEGFIAAELLFALRFLQRTAVALTNASVPTKSLLNFVYTRDIRPQLSGYASVSFINSVNSPTVVPGTTTVNFSQTTNVNTPTTLGLNYVLARTLTGSILYTFSYSSNTTVLPRSCPGMCSPANCNFC
jgi:hypothetical protein